ncbi:MAG: histidine kinase [Bacteroidota bacterium]
MWRDILLIRSKEATPLRVVIYIFFGLVFNLITRPHPDDYALQWIFSSLIAVVMWEGNGFVATTLDKVVTWIENPLRRLLLGVICMMTYTLGAAWLIGYLFYVIYMGKDMAYYNAAVPEFLYKVLSITFVLTLIVHSATFLRYWRDAALKAEKLKRSQLISQYSSLKHQLNPHFLFNSLNSLTALVYKDPDQAAEFIQHLSHTYRFVLENSEKELISLAAELKFTRGYLHLLEIRHGNNLKVEINLPENESMMVAPLTLQLLLENAIKHNIVSQNKPLRVDIFLDDQQHIVVKNNLQKKQIQEHSTGMGLKNIKERYQHLANKLVEVLENTDSFTVKVPVLTLKQA